MESVRATPPRPSSDHGVQAMAQQVAEACEVAQQGAEAEAGEAAQRRVEASASEAAQRGAEVARA